MYNIKKEFNHINKEFKLFVNDQPKNFEEKRLLTKFLSR